MLHCGGGTRWCVPARGQAAPPAADDDEAPPPDLAASWAAAPVAAAKGRKGRGVVLLSNGGGRRPKDAPQGKGSKVAKPPLKVEGPFEGLQRAPPNGAKFYSYISKEPHSEVMIRG
eukprot:scaffold35777_cov90-Isochrysis_galbana.AAC.1